MLSGLAGGGPCGAHSWTERKNAEGPTLHPLQPEPQIEAAASP